MDVLLKKILLGVLDIGNGHISRQKDIFGRREDLMMSWAERLGNGSSKRVC